VPLCHVRVWLPNRKINPLAEGLSVILTVVNTQLVDETVVPFAWSSKRVSVRCSRDHRRLHECQRVHLDMGHYVGGAATADFLTPIGPYADWNPNTHETLNPGRDLSNVMNVYVEFWISRVKFDGN
jgi:hypothetical protein